MTAAKLPQTCDDCCTGNGCDCAEGPSAATTPRRDTLVVILAKSQDEAREILREHADDPRVRASHVDLGDGKYEVIDRG